MSSLNKVMLIGSLGRDPEVKTFPDGGQIATISIATKETWKDKVTGEKKEATEWHRVVFNGRLAGVVGQYLRKGAQVHVEGSIKSRKYNDKDGIERVIWEIKASELLMLAKGGGSGGGEGGYSEGSDERGDGYRAPARPAQRPAPPAREREPAMSSNGFDGQDDDTDIPF